ncbi:hypothetical protein FNV43_RR12338 [Rhamnella rubrinervis]|uniref:tRNA (Cytosine(38)-C(5))-methyltransferase n=1 Tax=Rhamnella rubrinervis TaxID=2594499 RepID=A0A8K0MIQ6_9ROSA|nr:hypothetical protein FNV43_RR12338 [Rhamnella rubrinervis]
MEKRQEEPWKVLEFYSGIGGMRYSLIRAGVNAEIVEAFDINDKANDVYQHNFGHRPYQGNIQTLTAADLDGYGAHAWLLSPPCQPYTRQGLQKQSEDTRAFSFLKILELIPHTSKPPNMIFVENVVGFETSDTHSRMIETLAKVDFVTQEFILSPLQFGKRKPSSFQNPLFNNQLLWFPSPLSRFADHESELYEHDQPLDSLDNFLQSCEPIERFLEFKNDNQQPGDTTSVSLFAVGGLEKDDEGNRYDASSLDQYFVPLTLIESYYRYVKGTGSLLATVLPKKKGKASPLKEQCLRYFTPREVANLHSFPEDFQFPQHISLRQRYALLGNSLSIAVVAPLLEYLFAD